MGEHDDRLCSLPIIRRREGAAEQRPYAEHVEELGGDTRALDGDRIAAAGQDVAVPVDGGWQGGEALEALRLSPPLQELRVGELDEAGGDGPTGLPADDEAFLMGKGERLEDHGVQDAEHCGACANADCQRGDGNRGDT